MTWNDILAEIASTNRKGREGPHDLVRREKISNAESISNIPLIVYAAYFTNQDSVALYGAGLQIELEDKTGFLQALSDIKDGPLDILIHSPGGSPTATESIVKLLRSRFDPIRFIVPHTAKSAATMLALSGDEILLGEAAELGPIDPQLQFSVDQRMVNVPAGAAIDQFEKIIHKEVSKNPGAMWKWLPIVRQFGPSFLQECHNAINLSEQLVADWLEQYMFKDEENAEGRAKKVAKWLANHSNFNSHARPVWMDQLLQIDPEMKIRSLRDVSKDFEAAIMDVYWAIDATFGGTDAFKVIEHTKDAAYIRLQRLVPSPGQAPAPRPRPRSRSQSATA